MVTRNGAVLASPSNISQITDLLSEKPMCVGEKNDSEEEQMLKNCMALTGFVC